MRQKSSLPQAAKSVSRVLKPDIDRVLTAEEERAIPPGQEFQECKDYPRMIVVPAGRFSMGSPESETDRSDNEGPQHEVTIGNALAVGRFAVMRGEFAAFVKDTGHKTGRSCYACTGPEWKQQLDQSWRSPGFERDDRHPAVCVNWDDAKAYGAWFARKTAKPYRLLSEAEREYATRAGATTPFWWGSPSQRHKPITMATVLMAAVPKANGGSVELVTQIARSPHHQPTAASQRIVAGLLQQAQEWRDKLCDFGDPNAAYAPDVEIGYERLRLNGVPSSEEGIGDCAGRAPPGG
jgi:hypothetical protein